jgi:hypothetical protein
VTLSCTISCCDMAYVITLCYLITPSKIASHYHRQRLLGRNGRSSERMRTLADRKMLKRRLLLISRYLYTTHTTPVTSLLTPPVADTHRHVQTHTRRVAVALTYSCSITVTSHPCNLTSYPIFLFPTIKEMELGGGDESDRDRAGTLDPDDAEDSTGKPASDEKDRADAEEEKEDTPQVTMPCHAMPCCDWIHYHCLPSCMRYSTAIETYAIASLTIQHLSCTRPVCS